MYPAGVAEIGVIILLLWLSILSYFFWKQNRLVNQLFPKGMDKELGGRLKEFLEEIEEFDKKEQIFIKHLAELKKESLGFVQKVALVRYNPYSDTGGDQSVSVVLLNGKLNGFVLTSLHSRTGTRVYTKHIIKGKSDIELSKEEKQALDQAINNE